MDHSSQVENGEDTEKQETIFKELSDVSKYERNVKHARYWLYMIAGYWLVYGFAQYNKIQEYNEYLLVKQNAWYNLAIYLVFSTVFLTLAFWSLKKASVAFLAALFFYTAVSVWFISISSFNLQDSIIRVLVIVILIKGYKDGRAYEIITKTLGGYP